MVAAPARFFDSGELRHFTGTFDVIRDEDEVFSRDALPTLRWPRPYLEPLRVRFECRNRPAWKKTLAYHERVEAT